MSRAACFLLFCVSFIGGIFLGSYFSISLWILFLLAGFLIPLVFLLKNNNRLKLAFLLAIFLALGFIRVESVKLKESDIANIEKLDNQAVSISGTISQPPEIKNGKQKLLTDNLKNSGNGEDILGKIIIYGNLYPEYDFNDKIVASGKLKIPEDFDGFEYRNYLYAKGIYYIMYYPKIERDGQIQNNKEDSFYNQTLSSTWRFRKYINDLIKKIFPQPQAGIVNAVMLGSETDINEDILKDFNKTGTRHIFAVSGSNITLISVALMYFLLALGLKRDYAFYFAVLGILGFVSIVGFPSSAVRAAIMGGTILLAVKVGRLSSAGNAIVFAASAMLLYDPNLSRYDVGFQLSFLAVLGIIYIFPRLNASFEKYSDFCGIKTILLITVSAQIATLPIVINSFGNFSFSSTLANVFILPFVPVVMLGGFLVVILGFVNLYIAQILSWPIWLVLFYQIEVIKFFSNLPFGNLSFEGINYVFIFGYYAVLVAWLLVQSRTYKH